MKSKAKLHPFLSATGCAVLATTLHAADGTWNTDSGGNWNDGTKWTIGTVASGTNSTATLGNVITGNRVITLDAPIIIGNITASDTNRNYTISGANTLTLDRDDSVVPTIEVTTSSRTLTIGSVIAGNDGLKKTGAGTLTLDGQNTYTGNTIIDAGTVISTVSADTARDTNNVALHRHSAFGKPASTSTITINSGAVLTGGDTNNWLSWTSATAADSHTVVINAGGKLQGANFDVITGLGNTTLNGGTIEVVKGLNDAQNGSFVLRGSLSVGGSVPSAITTGAGASTRGNFELGGNTRTFTVNDVTGSSAPDLVVSARIHDGTVNKQGAGTVELTNGTVGTGTAAAWNANVGTLLVNTTNGLDTGTIAVAANATLGGNGTVGGATTFTGASIHAPGSAPATVGTQTFSSTLAYGTGTIFDWDIDVDGSSSTCDKVVATGAITGGDAVFKIVLAAGDSFADAFWNSDRIWTDIFSGAGAPDNLAAVFSAFDASGGLDAAGLVSGQGQFTLSSSANTLSWTAVIPEPSTALAGLLLTAGLLRRRRFR